MSRWSDEFSIEHKEIGKGKPCFIIAEAGVAHFGDLNKAYRLVDMAVNAEADAVKFQIFDSEEMISGASPEWLNRMKSRELPYDDFKKLQDYCQKKNIIFMATAHDKESLNYLISLDVPAFKIGSGELQNWEMLKDVASTGKPVILSTGMYSLEDLKEALSQVELTGNSNIAVLHCVTEYPTRPDDVNLKAINTISETFDVITGYSDHTDGNLFPIGAVALGASVIEKHISLDFNVPDAQDWKVSCGPESLATLVKEVRDLERGLGTGEKTPSKGEEISKAWATKSLVAKTNINKGTKLSEEMITSKRPGTGLPPSERESLIGKRLLKDVREGEQFDRESLK